jgi:two-component sensor histidine kinase
MEGDQANGNGSWLGSGGVAALILARDWSSTALGPIDQWPQCLRTALSICLHSSEPVAVYWGPEFVTLYNDVCAEFLGDAHPNALGMPAARLYESVWPTIGPLFNRTLREGVSMASRNQPLPICHLGESEHQRFDFTTTPVCADDGQIGGIMVFAFDVTQHVLATKSLATEMAELQRLQAQEHVLIAELQHRTRNLLAVVRAIAAQTFEKHLAENVLGAFVERLSSLGRVQGLLSRADNERVKLIDVVWAELEAYASDCRSRLEVHGPSVKLFQHQVQTMALALHELVTNALKYGALRSPGGRLSVTWETWLGAHGQQRLALTWRESGVSMPPDVGTRRGQGRELIENSLRFSLHADTQLVFGDDGVWCRIELPVDAKKLAAPGAAALYRRP